MSENKTPQKQGIADILMQNWPALIVAVLAFVVFAVILPRNSSTNKKETLISPFGQEPLAQWVSLPNQEQAEIVATFPIHYPTVLQETCNTMEFNVFGKQIIEIQFKDGDGHLTAVAAKGKGEIELCNDTTAYRKTEIIDVGDLEVTVKGSNDTVSLALWHDAEYSYYLGVQNYPVSQEEMIKLIQELY
jgi:hypothetical protein